MHGRQQIVADRADRRILAHILTAHWTRSVAADVFLRGPAVGTRRARLRYLKLRVPCRQLRRGNL